MFRYVPFHEPDVRLWKNCAITGFSVSLHPGQSYITASWQSICAAQPSCLIRNAQTSHKQLITFCGHSLAFSLSDTSLLQQWSVSSCNRLYRCCGNDKDKKSIAKATKNCLWPSKINTSTYPIIKPHSIPTTFMRDCHLRSIVWLHQHESTCTTFDNYVFTMIKVWCLFFYENI